MDPLTLAALLLVPVAAAWSIRRQLRRRCEREQRTIYVARVSGMRSRPARSVITGVAPTEASVPPAAALELMTPLSLPP
jgi:hypothetical protein